MKNVMQVFFKDHTSIRFEVLVKETNDTFLKVHELKEGKLPLFIELEHQQVITHLELTKMYPYVLLYFNSEDDEILFKGAAFNCNKSEMQFSITTQYKKILLVPFPIQFKLEDVSHITLNN
jgi:hypothetical protein